MSLRQLLCLTDEDLRCRTRKSKRVHADMAISDQKITHSRRRSSNFIYTEDNKTPEMNLKIGILSSIHYYSKLAKVTKPIPKVIIKGSNRYDVTSNSFKATNYAKEKLDHILNSLNKTETNKQKIDAKITTIANSPLKRSNDSFRSRSLMTSILKSPKRRLQPQVCMTDFKPPSKRPITRFVLGVKDNKKAKRPNYAPGLENYQNSPTTNAFSVMEQISPNHLIEPILGMFHMAEIKKLTEKQMHFQKCRRIILKVAFRITALKRGGFTNEEVTINDLRSENIEYFLKVHIPYLNQTGLSAHASMTISGQSPRWCLHVHRWFSNTIILVVYDITRHDRPALGMQRKLGTYCYVPYQK